MASGKVQTVLGLIEPEKLGRTLTHEHIHLDMRRGVLKSSKHSDSINMNDITLRNIGWIRQNPFSHPYSLALSDEPVEDMIQELMAFKKEGGCSVVDNTSIGVHKRNVEFQKKVSIATGLNFISGTGYYLDGFIPEEIKATSVESLVDTIVKEITVGVDGTDIKCGVIGEVGCSWPITEFEKKSLQAAAMAQTATGAPVIVHPGRSEAAPKEHIRVFQEAGGDVNRMVMSHLSVTAMDKETLLDLASTGCYLAVDTFGIEVLHLDLFPNTDLPSDSQRVQLVKFLLSEGYQDRVLISHDNFARHSLIKYGGYGYSHIQTNIIPKMLIRGISQDEIDQMQISNPKALFTFK